MSEHYPRLRIAATTGLLVVRETVSLKFYMKRSSLQVAPMVVEALDKYADLVGPPFGWHPTPTGAWKKLDAKGWEEFRAEIMSWPTINAGLGDESGREQRYRFEYKGQSPEAKPFPSDFSEVCFWFPTEYLEEHGPARMRAIAIDLLGSLPICSGYVGLDLNACAALIGMRQILTDLCLRYPGIDCWDLIDGDELGTKIRSPAWMTLIGQPTLGEIGGVEALRARLQSPGTTVEDLGGDRALVTLGEWPEAGDTRHGKDLPAYRELAKALEPWLFRNDREHYNSYLSTAADYQRWLRRFLD